MRIDLHCHSKYSSDNWLEPGHPFRGWDSFGEDVYGMNGVDAIETYNGSNLEGLDQKAIHVARLRGLSSAGGSDCHKKEEVGRAFTEFDHPVQTIDELVEDCSGIF